MGGHAVEAGGQFIDVVRACTGVACGLVEPAQQRLLQVEEVGEELFVGGQQPQRGVGS
ncbi:hypothetical protein [Streptomyces geranii]|uniref:hypothetical protein n=1 Tax=Streptomyces geranii TaxID=2058923 RepID=UPI0013005BD1|nr:hypothetical protein [Streptomyces geranii]